MLKMITPLPKQITHTPLQLPKLLTKPETGSLVSYSLPWPDLSPLDFLRQAPHAPRLYWSSEKAPFEFAGYGVAAALVAHGSDRFQTIRQQAAQLFEKVILLNEAAPPAAAPRLFGGFSFRVEDKSQPFWSAFPAARFVLPRYQLSRSAGETWLTINRRFGPADDPLKMAWLIQEEVQKLRTALSLNRTKPAWIYQQPRLETIDLMAAATWDRLITDVTQCIRRGELEKVVLARARRVRASGPVDVVQILSQLERTYPSCYRFLFEPAPGHAFYGATPELLADVAGSTLHTAALASSIRRGSSPAEDEALSRQLMADPKERREHALVVEAIRENLQPLATRLSVAPQPDICRLSNIQHLQTIIEAELPPGCGILPIIETLHPTPALGGRPRAVALPLIEQAEPVSRGWYGAPVGWLDQHGDGMFAVAIRSALTAGNETMLYAGAGIVADSIPEKEWQETELKFKPLLEALTGANRP